MKYKELLTEAVSSLLANKARTFLATLGIVIGVASVIALLSLGQGGQKAVEQSIESLGSNLLTVIPGALRAGDIRSAAGTITTLTLDDAIAIKNKRIPGVLNVSAEILRRFQVVAGRKNTNTQVIGVLPSYKEIRNIKLQNGTFFTKKDILSWAKVAVLGPQVVSDLFGEGANPVGQTIKINQISFRVIGTTVPKGGTGFGANQDDMVLIPLSTAQKQLFGVNYVGSISIQVADKNQMDAVRDQVGYFLLARHKISNPQNADFTIFSQADILNTAQQVTGVFTTLLSGIAAISLLVGGIGIMNIMLVTVTERTREIGLRKAIGATKKTIISQFLIEAAILTLSGGIIGIFLGIGISFGLSGIINIPFSISLFSILLATGVSILIGIVFGLYPAQKASSLQPIEALRYE